MARVLCRVLSGLVPDSALREAGFPSFIPYSRQTLYFPFSQSLKERVKTQTKPHLN